MYLYDRLFVSVSYFPLCANLAACETAFLKLVKVTDQVTISIIRSPLYCYTSSPNLRWLFCITGGNCRVKSNKKISTVNLYSFYKIQTALT